MGKKIIIAIDGFSACGKSTLARQLALRFDLLHIDSGAMYRAITLHFLRNKIDLDNSGSILLGLSTANLKYDSCAVFLGTEDVSEEIRKMYISEKVSKISSNANVRSYLIERQRQISKDIDVVMDGRDIGTHVFPNADIKFFLTADVKTRAIRRFNEINSLNAEISLNDVLSNLITRDYDDSKRKVSPMTQAKDAIIIDNTSLSENEQLNIAASYILKFLSEVAE